LFPSKTAADKRSLVREAALLIGQGLESEAVEARRRGYYERGAQSRDYRNGYWPRQGKERRGRYRSAGY
jgi:hypothetical protein